MSVFLQRSKNELLYFSIPSLPFSWSAMSNPFDWEHDSASEGLSSLAADLGIDKTANLIELKSRLSVGIDQYGCIHGTVVRGEDSEEREIYLRGNI